MRSLCRLSSTSAICCCIGAALAVALSAQADRSSFEVLEASIDDVQAALISHRVTCHQLVDQYLSRIDAFNRRGPNLNAVETANRNALDDASRLDRLEATSNRGPLHCVPILVKDELNTSGLETTYGSAAFKG